MPHTFTPRTRRPAIGVTKDALVQHFIWEAINATCYLLGGIVFIVGSIYFLPQYEDQIAIGCWMFVAGSILYLAVSLHDCAELYYSKEAKLIDAAAAFLYTAGAIIFICGSVFYLPDKGKYDQGTWCFITGSIVFIIGAVLNAMQIFNAESKLQARCLNLTAACYMIGSVMFLFGSIPYLITFESESDEQKVDELLGWTFIVGSVFFFLGGCINIARARFLLKEDVKKFEERKKAGNTDEDNGGSAAATTGDNGTDVKEESGAE